MSKACEDLLVVLLAWPLVCGWLAVVVKCLAPRKVDSDAKNLLVSYTTLSGRWHVGMP